jgi:cytochrome c oxidase cbb3-type subunit 3
VCFRAAGFSVIALTALCLAVLSCNREKRELRPSPARLVVYGDAARESLLQPGGIQTQPKPTNPYEGNALAVSEGQRLFSWYNCTGCHANGGGAIGPPLIKDVWIYGNEPANLFDTIVKGRPNGMPAWGGRIPEYQIWQLVAWVRAMNKLEPQAATPQRLDTIEQDAGTILDHPPKVAR